MKNTLQVIGLMSGTSLDGLDVCCATFTRNGQKRWDYHIDAAQGYGYTPEMQYKLGTGAQKMSALEFITFHSEYGYFMGDCVNDFLSRHRLHPDLVASHGHTIFHEPHRRVMFQIGDGAALAARTGLPVVSDFRRLDIMLGGQGAPLVPIGDRLLFGQYDYCLNIGGFSNISFELDRERIAFDISPVNYVINHYCRSVRGLDFDRDGLIAREGNIHEPLLRALNGLPFYDQAGPKSLGREWVEQEVFPLIDSMHLSLPDILRTFYEHAAFQVAQIIRRYPSHKENPQLLVTGGGAYNLFLIERISALSACRVIIPDALTIEYKEALIFAFLGALYLNDEPSCLSSVTGASRDNIGGMLFKL